MPAVPSARPRPLHFAAFVMNTTGHIIQGTWRRPTARQTEFNDLEHWVPLVKTLERGKFDAVFLFGQGDRLPERHPAARYRGAFAPQPA